MIPRSVTFTGLTIDPMVIHKPRRHTGPIPPDWTRVRFEVDDYAPLDKINRWLPDQIDGRWRAYTVVTGSARRLVVIAFEQEVDAVLFRLKGGETAWREPIPAS